MKKTNLLSTILGALLICFVSTSCSTDDNNNAEQIAQIKTFAQSGTWKITRFIDSGVNETSDFTGYNFTFEDNGTLTATNGTNTLSGSWSVTNDSSSSSDDDNSDDSSNDIDFNIFFAVLASNNFEDLNDDWDIVSTSATTIQLIDVSGGNGGTDFLTFEKN